MDPVTTNTITLWEAPLALTRVRGRAEFPVGSLPKALADWVTAEAEATQTPIALAGVLALTTGAAAMAGRVEVEVRKGWREPTNLFAAVALPPGNRKSAVMADAARPLLAAEDALIEERRPEVAAAQSRRRILEQRLKIAEGKAARAKTATIAREQEAEAERLAEELAATPRQCLPRLIADDATPEAVAGLLAEQHGRLAVLSAEGGIFDTIAGRYSNGVANLDVFLKGHAGDDLRVDRRGRDAEIVKHPALTMALAIQPAVLTAIGASQNFHGRGLLARFLYDVPPSNVGSRAINPAPVPDRVADAYAEVVERLAKRFANSTETGVVVFGAEAEGLFRAFEERHEARLGPGRDLAHIAEWGAKLPGAVARIAGVLHVLAYPDGWEAPIDVTTVDDAIQLGHYFSSQAVATFEAMAADPLLDKARLLGRWIKERTTFTKREAHRAHQASFPRVADLDEVLDLLLERGWIRAGESEGPNPRGGRHKSEKFVVNPFVAVTTRTEPTEPPPDGGIVSSVTVVSPSQETRNPLCEVCSQALVTDSDLASGMPWHEKCRPEVDEDPTERDLDVAGLVHLSDGPVIWPTSADIESWSPDAELVEMAR